MSVWFIQILQRCLLVVDVKQNRLYYAWLTHAGTRGHRGVHYVAIPVTQVDEAVKTELRKQLSSLVPCGSHRHPREHPPKPAKSREYGSRTGKEKRTISLAGGASPRVTTVE